MNYTKYYLTLLLGLVFTCASVAQSSEVAIASPEDQLTVEYARSTHMITTTLQVAKSSLEADSPRDRLYSVTIVDPQGFTHDQPLTRKPLTAGPHSLEISTDSWRPGTYRILFHRDGDIIATRKIKIAASR